MLSNSNAKKLGSPVVSAGQEFTMEDIVFLNRLPNTTTIGQVFCDSDRLVDSLKEWVRYDNVNPDQNATISHNFTVTEYRNNLCIIKYLVALPIKKFK